MELKTGLCDFKILGADKNFIGLTSNIVEREITGTVTLGDIPLSTKDKKVVSELPMADSLFNRA